MNRFVIGFGGFVGGAAPYLLGMAKNAVGIHTGEPSLWANPGYWFGLTLFGLIGAFVVLYLGETDKRKALALGAAAPGLVLGLAQGNAGTASSGQHALSGFEWVHRAYAQRPTRPVVVAPRQVSDTLWVRVLGVDSAQAGMTDLVAARSLATKGQRSPESVAFHLTNGTFSPVLRSRMDSLYVVSRGVRTLGIPVSSAHGDTLTLQLTLTDQSSSAGFLRVFGITKNATKAELRVTQKLDGGDTWQTLRRF